MRLEKAVAVSLFILLGVYIVSGVVGEHDGTIAFVVNFAFAVGAAVWVWKDAQRIELVRYQSWLTNSHTVCAILTFLFTYIFLPCYVVKRVLILSGHGVLLPEDGLDSRQFAGDPPVSIQPAASGQARSRAGFATTEKSTAQVARGTQTQQPNPAGTSMAQKVIGIKEAIAAKTAPLVGVGETLKKAAELKDKITGTSERTSTVSGFEILQEDLDDDLDDLFDDDDE